MADIAAKREARRKRILENSESRLRRITSVYQDRETDNKPKHNLNLGNSVPVLNTYDVFATHNEVDGEEEDNEIEFLNKAAGFKEVEDSPVKNVTRFKRKWIVALIAVAFKILLVLSKKIDILDIESLEVRPEIIKNKQSKTIYKANNLHSKTICSKVCNCIRGCCN
ncbi:hypothetical protein QE152_g25457 [Popillia japonica]|uniref:Uncharacterized protein n=1 Tax=Popillia japonica TaxID=7064 RepID=A0AAW1K1K7_POPJA